MIALGLIAGTVVALWATSDIGSTRDESFYFRYAQIYQDWLSRVADPTAPNQPGDDRPEPDPLGRHDVVSTWSQNFEHPPLLKVLFGLSWRVFATKRRRLNSVREDTDGSGGILARISDLTESEGFRVGDEVSILGPMPVDGDRGDAARRLANGEITERFRRHAMVRIDGATIDELRDACREPKAADRSAPPPWMVGCQAATAQPLQRLSETTALRLPAWIFAGLLIGLLYLFGTELFGRWAGAFAALSFLFVPRPFFHAHLCSFDVPVTTVIVATLYAFWRSLRSPNWAIVCGVCWGLALLTKLNAFFIPLPLVFAWLATPAIRWAQQGLGAVRAGELEPPSLRRGLRMVIGLSATVGIWWWAGPMTGLCVALLWAAAEGLVLRLPPIPKAFIWMPPIGLAMLFLLWPRMWYDPASAFWDYANFHLSHVHYLQQYFGTILAQPPFPVSFPWVLTALTVPVVLLIVFGVGAVTLFAVDRARVPLYERVFLAANLLFPILLISMPGTPIFGGIKHWLVAMAFFSLIGGYGFDWMRRTAIATLPAPKPVKAFACALALGLLIAPGAVSSITHVRFGTSYYNELAGGVRGGADQRMHRQFWGYAGRYALEWVNRNAGRNQLVAFHNTTHDAYTFYRRDGLLRQDIRWRRDPPERCPPGTIYLFHHQESFAKDLIDAWDRMKTWVPEEIIAIDGVPIISIYRCRKSGSDEST